MPTVAELAQQELDRRYSLQGRTQVAPRPQTMQNVRPTIRSALSNLMRDAVDATGLEGGYRQGLLNAAGDVESAVDFLPVVGDAIAVDDAARAYGQGDMIGAGINMMSVVPVVGDIAAKGAKTSRSALFNRAPDADKFKSRETAITMSPDEFLNLADDLPKNQVRQDSEEFIRNQISQGEKLDTPYLTFELDDKGVATVTGHEGRHRARVLKEMGITEMPVSLKSQGKNSIRWSEQTDLENYDRLDVPWPTTLLPQKESSGRAISFPVTDPLAAQSGKSALRGLDMNLEARMQRAQDLGFDTSRPLYHSTNSSFDSFEVPEGGFLKYGKGVYTTPKPQYADRYIRENRDLDRAYKEGANVMPLYARGNIATEQDWEAARQDMMSEGVSPSGYNQQQAELQRRLKEQGFDGLNMFGDEIIIFDPKNIRSTNAEFDPTKADSADLLSSVGTTSALRGIA